MSNTSNHRLNPLLKHNISDITDLVATMANDIG